jgi:hypothetical protein
MLRMSIYYQDSKRVDPEPMKEEEWCDNDINTPVG